MSKVIDITDKLEFAGRPKLRIKDVQIEVKDDAATMLKIMGILGERDEPGPREVMSMYNLMFDKEEQEKIDGLKLNFSDFTTVISNAISLINGEDDTPGE